jgi:hypothetical protein
VNNTENTEEDYSPYCPVCGGCGEDGCCSALNCKQDPDGHYCETYLRELKLRYAINNWFENELLDLLPQELKDRYDDKWDEFYDEVYSNENKE